MMMMLSRISWSLSGMSEVWAIPSLGLGHGLVLWRCGQSGMGLSERLRIPLFEFLSFVVDSSREVWFIHIISHFIQRDASTSTSSSTSLLCHWSMYSERLTPNTSPKIRSSILHPHLTPNRIPTILTHIYNPTSPWLGCRWLRFRLAHRLTRSGTR